MRAPAIGATLLAAVIAGCVQNTAPGNDRAAELDAPARPAEVAAAGAALAGVAAHLVYPEIMTDADLANLPADGAQCRFRYTEVGFPVVAYGEAAVVKLNGRLVPLPRTGDGRYADGGVDVAVRPLGDPGEAGARFPAEFVIRLPGAPNELGFHGFATC